MDSAYERQTNNRNACVCACALARVRRSLERVVAVVVFRFYSSIYFRLHHGNYSVDNFNFHMLRSLLSFFVAFFAISFSVICCSFRLFFSHMNQTRCYSTLLFDIIRAGERDGGRVNECCLSFSDLLIGRSISHEPVVYARHISEYIVSS